MRINVAVPEAHVEAPVLDAALESVTRLNEKMLSERQVPTFERGLKQHGIRWKPEPPGAEHFDHAETVIQRKWGDCDDLAPWHAASLRHTGEDPGATAIVQKSGPRRWHAVVQRSDGSIDDPSRAAGMGQSNGIIGATIPLMLPASAEVGAYIARPQIALRPVRGAWQARADLPWYWREHLSDKPGPSDYAMSALHTAPVASTALVGALVGACDLGECAGFADPDHIDRLCAIADACEGVGYEELSEIYGCDHAEAAQQVVGSFFGNIAKGLGKVAHMAAPALNFIPGVGPIASQALNLATSALPSGVHLPTAAALHLPTSGMPGHGAAPSGGVSFHCVPF